MGNNRSKQSRLDGVVTEPVAGNYHQRPPEDAPSQETSADQRASALNAPALLSAQLVTHHEHDPCWLDPSASMNKKLRFVFEVVTSAFDSRGRPPFELCLVLDISGSMAGGKLDSLKNAVEVLLGLLNDDDVLHIISYNTDPTVLVDNASKRDMPQILKKVNDMKATGGTNISAALMLAARQLTEASVTQGDAAPAQKRIFLYTDGQPQSGLTTLEELSEGCREIFEERRVHVSTFGIGTDVNGPLLEAMAESGGGAYSFMTQRRMEELSKKALEDLSRVVATRGEVEVILLPPGAWTSFPEYSCERIYTFALGDIREGNKRRLPFCMDLPPQAVRGLLEQEAARPGAPINVARLVFSCQPIHDPLHVHLQEVDVACHVTDTPVLSAEPGPVVAVTFALADMSSRNDRAIQMIGDGSAESLQGAIQLLEEGIRNLIAVQEHDEESFVETAVRRVQRTLHRLQQRGLRDASRVALELQMQSNTFDRHSAAGFMHSDSGNHSQVRALSPPGSPMMAPFPLSRVVQPTNSTWDHFFRGVADSMDSHSDPDRSVSPDMRAGGHHAADPWTFRLPHAQPAAPLRPIDIPDDLKAAIDLKEREGDSAGPYIPPEFFCTITQAVMDDPVMTSDGNTYQRSAIEQWLADGNISSPLTGLGLCDLELRPNLALRSMIANWKGPQLPLPQLPSPSSQ